MTNSDGDDKDGFGNAVAIDGDTIVVGASSDNVHGKSGQGSVYTFAHTGAAARTETAKLTASDGFAGAYLGASVAIDGDVIAAGSNRAVYTFARTGEVARNETAMLTGPDGGPDSSFGNAVAVNDDHRILAGDAGADVGGNPGQGSASVLRTPLTLELRAKKRQQLEKLKVTVSCSTPCEVSARAKGRAQKRFRSRLVKRDLVEGTESRLRLRLPKSRLRKIGHEKGKAKVKVVAISANGESASDTVKVKIKP